MNKLPLHLIEALIAFYREGNMIAAARAIQSSQPTISRQLRKFQNILGEPLIEERGRNKVLTSFGLRVAKMAEACWSDFGQNLRDIHIESLPKERVPCRVAGRNEVLMRIFGNLVTTNPLELIPLNGDETRLLLERREVDIAVYQGNFVSSDYARKKIFIDSMGIAIPKAALGRATNWKTWLDSAPPLGLAVYKNDLKDLTLALKGEKASGLTLPKPVFVFPDWSVLEGRIARGLNWGLLPSTYANTEKSSSYTYFPLTTIEAQVFYIYYRLKIAQLPWLKALIK
jgi:DNA-binding transcriptional LysR family regulator